MIFPPFLSILTAAALLEGTDIGLGAQNLHWEAKGAYTGEISAEMIAEFCQYVLIGHSERRIYFGESDEKVNKKIFAAISHNLIPIVCIGETINEKESGQTEEILERQLRSGLMDLPNEFISSVILAYEPVWAIGTGKASTGNDARDVIRDIIRPVLEDMFGENVENTTRVLYGGSVTSANAPEFLNYEDIDGALVGGACLKADEFVRIVQAGAG